MSIENNSNIQSISVSYQNSFIYNKEKFSLEEENNETFINNNEIQDKNINLNLLIKTLNTKTKEEYIFDNFLDDIIEKNDFQNYEYNLEFLKNIFYGENNLIIKYKINFLENNKIKNINCINKHEIKMNDITLNNMYYFDKNYLKNILKNCFDINYDVEELNEGLKYFNIYIKMIKNSEHFEKIKKIVDYIEIKVNTNNNNFEWIGINSSIFKNLDKEKNDNENIKTFNCLIDDKSFSLIDKNKEINLNQFIFSVKILNSDKVYEFNDFPFIIYYSIN